MALQIADLMDKAVSHAMACGHFELVNGHEPVNQPLNSGLTAAVWAEQITPVRSSGLNSTSVLVVLQIRVYSSTKTEPLSAIDPTTVAAVDALCSAYVGDFTLGGLVRQVDIRGQHGVRLEVRAGYLQQSGDVYRVMTITLPLVVNDLWEETA